jgi:hypothetical protein
LRQNSTVFPHARTDPSAAAVHLLTPGAKEAASTYSSNAHIGRGLDDIFFESCQL